MTMTNFERITQSEETLAEFIVNAVVIYDMSRNIFITEAIEMAKQKDNVGMNCTSIYKDVVKWLKEKHNANT